MPTFTYRGALVREPSGTTEILLFSAPAREVDLWTGIPQRRRIEGSETAGFQRELKEKRITQLAHFLANPSNVIQNPLLAAAQDEGAIQVNYRDDQTAEISITVPDLTPSLAELLDAAIESLTTRIPELTTRPVSEERVAALREDYATNPEAGSIPTDSSSESEDSNESDTDADLDPNIGIFEEETQVVDFYDELKARQTVLAELEDEAADIDAIGGFDRNFLLSLTRPVVLVDGQHRLQGALDSIELRQESEAGQQRLIELLKANEDDADKANEAFRHEADRVLPVSLMLSSSPAEHVFQFVVVNQKATPMTSALLGTIVSTSLSRSESDQIRERLRSAGIEVEHSQAIAFMTRSDTSPFKNLVATGMSGDQSYALPWSVLGRLISIIRNLRGANQFHTMTSIDWARKYFDSNAFQESGIFGPEHDTPAARLEYWSSTSGPWRTLFIRFFTSIRDTFGDVEDMDAHNAWGSTRSNLFNMISLTVLIVDFFNWLHSTKRKWHDIDDMGSSVDEYLDGLNPQYFNRDWRMEGTKKDQPVIRRAWGEAWAEYRVSPERLPRVERYNRTPNRS